MVSLTSFLARERAIVAVVLAAVVYVLFAWTPSHYGEAARNLGIAKAGPVAGDARPVRSDDWAVTTPYFQIAVANDFGPRNEASPYKEPLKSFLAMPSRDWSMAFKPDLWGFLVLDPAHAYSLHYAMLGVAMLVGFAVLLRQLGCSPGFALGISAILFCSQFVQAWWSSNAPVFAWAPWTAVLFLWRGPWRLRLPALAYATAVWFVGELYPPLIISAALAMGMLSTAFRPDALRPLRLAGGLLAAAIGAGVAWLHYSDLIAVMRATVYPGTRISDGGGLHGLQMAAHAFPSLVTGGYDPLPLWETNACEIAVAGSFLPLAVASFCDHRALLDVVRHRALAVAIWLAGLAVLAAWILLPIPGRMAPLFNLVPPLRMLWGFGLLFHLGLAVVASQVPWRLTTVRVAAFALAVTAGWAVSKFMLAKSALEFSWFDLLVILLLGLLLLGRRFVRGLAPRRVVVLALALTAALTFGRFNPIQPATPMFGPQRGETLDALRAYAAANPKGWTVTPRHFGALLPGAGVPAANHVLLQPQLAFFRQAYPDMPADVFNETFNRYAHIKPTVRWAPTVLQADLIDVPADPFAMPLDVQVAAGMAKRSDGSVEHVEAVRLGPTRWGVSIEGWAPWAGVARTQSLSIALADPAAGRIVRASGYRLARPDIVTLRKDPTAFASGFGLRLEVETAAGAPAPQRFAIVAHDPQGGAVSIGQ